MTWIEDVFGAAKPVIGMCHLQALPGDPHYDAAAGMEGIVTKAFREVEALQEGGVDGILISNEFSLPYVTKTEPITSAAMVRVITEVRTALNVPFGVDVLWDASASIDVAAVTGAAYVREVFTGVYASDFGLWTTDVGAIARHRRHVSAEGVRLLYNVVPEAAVYAAARPLAEIVRSTVFNTLPDALCVSGLTAGAATDIGNLRAVKAAAGDVPVIVNTGVTDENVGELLGVADAAIIGTFLKEDGVFERSVDVTRTMRLMAAARSVRKSSAGDDGTRPLGDPLARAWR